MNFRVIYTDGSENFATGITKTAAIAIVKWARRTGHSCYIAPELVRPQDLRALRFILLRGLKRLPRL